MSRFCERGNEIPSSAKGREITRPSDPPVISQ